MHWLKTENGRPERPITADKTPKRWLSWGTTLKEAGKFGWQAEMPQEKGSINMKDRSVTPNHVCHIQQPAAWLLVLNLWPKDLKEAIER